jgi:LacI family transcriptional regulator
MRLRPREFRFGGQTVDDLTKFCCQNSECPDYGRRGAGNLSVTMRHGKDKQLRMLRCSTCQDRFSERKGTPLFRAWLPAKKAVSVLEHIAEGCGGRKTARLTGVSRNAVGRYSRLAGEHAEALHDELVALSPRNT